MKKLRLFQVSTVVLLLLNVGLLVFHFMAKPDHKHEGPRDQIINRLQFNKEQVAAFDKLIAEHRSEVAAAAEDIKRLKNETYMSLNDPEASAEDALGALSAAHNRMELIHYNHFQQVRDLCDEGQKVEFERLSKDLAKMFAPHRKPPKRK